MLEWVFNQRKRGWLVTFLLKFRNKTKPKKTHFISIRTASMWPKILSVTTWVSSRVFFLDWFFFLDSISAQGMLREQWRKEYEACADSSTPLVWRETSGITSVTWKVCYCDKVNEIRLIFPRHSGSTDIPNLAQCSFSALFPNTKHLMVFGKWR